VEAALLKEAGPEAPFEKLIESAPDDAAKAQMREMLKKLGESQSKREPVDPPMDAKSPRRSLQALFREPCKP
jgi:hypothetical protein